MIVLQPTEETRYRAHQGHVTSLKITAEEIMMMLRVDTTEDREVA